ncbi:hypothetical protein V8C86DRAFT_2766425 [Haematococcus lacustris]
MDRSIKTAMDRLYHVLGSWLRGQCLAQSLLLAAGHPQWKAQRAVAVSSLLPLMEALASNTRLRYLGRDIPPMQLDAGPGTLQPGPWLHILRNSPIITGWPGLLPANTSGTLGQPSAVSGDGGCSTGAHPDLPAVNSYAHICLALSSLVLQHPESSTETMGVFEVTTPGGWVASLTGAGRVGGNITPHRQNTTPSEGQAAGGRNFNTAFVYIKGRLEVCWYCWHSRYKPTVVASIAMHTAISHCH